MIMITEQTIKETLTILKVAYPNALKDLSKEDAYIMIKLWYEDFKDCKKDIFMQAVKNVRSKSVFFPSIADIKREIQENATYKYTDILTRTVELQVFDGQEYCPIIPPESQCKKKRKAYDIG